MLVASQSLNQAGRAPQLFLEAVSSESQPDSIFPVSLPSLPQVSAYPWDGSSHISSRLYRTANLRQLWPPAHEECKRGEKSLPHCKCFLVYCITTWIKKEETFHVIIRSQGIYDAAYPEEEMWKTGNHKVLFFLCTYCKQCCCSGTLYSVWQIALEYSAITQSRAVQLGSHWPRVPTKRVKNCVSPKWGVL